jgi:sugar phosphate isomerase/epimerase
VTDLTLWMGTVAQGTFTARLGAAAACGYTSMSAAPTDCVTTSPELLRRHAEAAGIRLVALDPLVSWLPGRRRPTAALDPRRRALLDGVAGFTVDQVLDLAAALGCTSVSAIEPYGVPVAVATAAEALAGVCDRAADRGLVVHLEAMPFSGIPDLATALSIVQLAGRDNAGLVLDTWHLFRSGGDASLIASLPVDRLSVQLCDAPAVPGADPWTEALDRRLLPGDGDLDLVGVVEALRARGFTGVIGPEVISAELRALSPVDAATRAMAACRRLLETPPRSVSPDPARRGS